MWNHHLFLHSVSFSVVSHVYISGLWMYKEGDLPSILYSDMHILYQINSIWANCWNPPLSLGPRIHMSHGPSTKMIWSHSNAWINFHQSPPTEPRFLSSFLTHLDSCGSGTVDSRSEAFRLLLCVHTGKLREAFHSQRELPRGCCVAQQQWVCSNESVAWMGREVADAPIKWNGATETHLISF